MRRDIKLEKHNIKALACLVEKKNINTAYTIARSNSFGMNCTFAKCGYDFGGILVRNTQIGGKIEDMNVWFKSI